MPVQFSINADGAQAARNIQQTGKAFGTLGKRTKGTTSTFAKFTAGAVAVNQALEIASKVARTVTRAYGATVGAMMDLSKESANLADDVAKTSRAFGVSTDFLQGWRTTAGLAGVATEQADRALLNIQKSALDAGRGLSTAADLFEMAGVDALDMEGNVRSADAILKDLSKNLSSGLIPAQNQAAVSSQLLRDRSGKVVLALKSGPDAIQENIDRLREWDVLMSEDLLRSSEEYNDSVQRLGEAQRGMANAIAEETLPLMANFNNALAEAVGENKALRDIIPVVFGTLLPKAVELLVWAGKAALQTFFQMEVVFLELASALVGTFAKITAAVADTLFMVARAARAAGREGLANQIGEAAKEAAILERKTAVTAANMKKGAEWYRDLVGKVEVGSAAFIETLRAGPDGAGGAGGAGGGEGDGEGGGPKEDDLIVIPTGTEINLGDLALEEAEKVKVATKSMASDFGSVFTAIGDMGAALATTTDKGDAFRSGMKSVFKAIIQEIAAMATASISASASTAAAQTASNAAVTASATPAAVAQAMADRGASAIAGAAALSGAIAGATALVTGIIDGIGDKGKAPFRIGDSGVPRVPVSGTHSMTMLRNNEMVLDARGTTRFERQMKLSNQLLQGAVDASRGELGRMGGSPADGGSVRVIQLVAKGRVLAEVVDNPLADMARMGRSRFAQMAQATA